MLLPGDGERREDTRFELVAWAAIHRANGAQAGKVLVTDISRGGLNMQSRWDFSIQETVRIEITPSLVLDANIGWHDPVVGAYGCRFTRMLSREAFEDILSKADAVPDMTQPAPHESERREADRVHMRVPVTARRASMAECEVAVLTNLSATGLRLRSTRKFDIDQIIYVELGPMIVAEARVLRYDPATSEYAASFRFGLSPLLIERLIANARDQ
jgi:hypothetical protein